MSEKTGSEDTEFLQEVLDTLEEVFFVFTPEGKLVRWNSRVPEVTGYADDEIAGMHPIEFVLDEEVNLIKYEIGKVLREGRVRFEAHFVTKEGEELPYEFTGRLLEREGQQLICGTGRDIRGRRRAEEQVRRLQERFEQTLQQLPVYVFTQDRDLRYTWLSNSIPGMDTGDLLGKKDGDVFPVEDVRRLRYVKERVLETESPARSETQVTLNGTVHYFDTYLAPQYDEEGRPNGVVGASVDITERKREEQQRQASERRYRELFEAAQDGIVIHTSEGRILDINRAGLDMLGYSREQLEALETADIYPYPEQVERGRKMMEAEGEVRNLEVTLRRKDGAEIVCLLSSTARVNEADQTEQYFTIFRDITERKQYQDQFRLLVEEVEDYAIFMLDVNGQIISWNEGAEKIKGYGREEILGRHLSVFYTEEDREVGEPERALEKAVDEGRVENEGWRVRRDGSRFWARATLTALRDDQGRLRGFAKVTRDLTREREREQALRESEERYRRLFEESQEGITMTTPDGELIDVNPAAQEIFGYSRKELEEISLRELYVDPQERREAIEVMRERGAIRSMEVRLRRKDGEEIICQLSSTASRGPDGEIEAFQTFFRDITAQKRAQEALEESEEKFRTVAEKALVGIGLVQDGVMQYVNPCYAEIFGYEEEELVGRPPEVFIHPDDHGYVQRQIERRLAGQTESVRYQFKGLTRDGEVRYLDVYGGRITYRGRSAVIATVMDITRERRLEEQLLEIQEAERRRIGQELHDGIASQLTGVTMIGESLTQALQLGGEVTPSDLKELTDLVRESAQQTRLLSRGLNPVQVGKEGLPAALEQLAERTEKQSGLSCRFDAEGEVPELDEQKAAHLYRIAQEAVTNAARHAEASSIEIHLSAVDGTVKLSVVDDGKGLPREAREKGEGLGLHTMRYRADIIGGRLEITSGSEGGTIVRCEVSRQ